MFILNKKTNVIQECGNKDIIKICKKDPERYQVAEKAEDLRRVKKDSDTSTDLDNMNVSELRTLAKEKGIEGYSGHSKTELLEILKGVV